MDQENKQSKIPLFIAAGILIVIAIVAIVILGSNKNSKGDKQSSQSRLTTTTIVTSTNPMTDIETMCSAHLKTTGSEAPFKSSKDCSKFLESLIGLSEEDATKKAEANKVILRVTHRDGEDFITTMDFISDRVNISVDNGKITAVTLG